MSRSASIQTRHSNSTTLVLGVSIVVVVAALILIAKPDASPSEAGGLAVPSAKPVATAALATSSSAGGLTARDANFDFGAISMAAGKVSHRYWFRNEGDAPVLVKRIYTSCMCTTATLVKASRVVGSYGMPGHGPLPDVNQTFAPGEAAYVDVVFDPAAHGPAGLGHTERVVTIEGGAGQPLQLGFVALVRP
jgi:hypothetical protein